MNIKAFVTFVLVILTQILSTSHMLPSSQYRRSELDLLLDPIHQSEQEFPLESKKIFTKSVYNTPLLRSTPCPEGTRRVSPSGGPCLKINVSEDLVYDEKFLSAALQNLGRQRPSNNRRPGNGHRHRNKGSTNGRRTTTTEMPFSVSPGSTLQDLDGSNGGGGDFIMMELTSTIPPYISEPTDQQESISETQQPEIYTLPTTSRTVTTSTTTRTVLDVDVGKGTQIPVEATTVNDENDLRTTAKPIRHVKPLAVLIPTVTPVPSLLPVNLSDVKATGETLEGINSNTPTGFTTVINASANSSDDKRDETFIKNKVRPNLKPLTFALEDNSTINDDFNTTQVNNKKSSVEPATKIFLDQNQNVTAIPDERVITSDVTDNNFPFNSKTIAFLSNTNTTHGTKDDHSGVTFYNKSNQTLSTEEKFTTGMTPLVPEAESSGSTDALFTEAMPQMTTMAIDELTITTPTTAFETDDEPSATDEPAPVTSISTPSALTEKNLKKFNYSDNSLTDLSALSEIKPPTLEHVSYLEKITTLALTPQPLRRALPASSPMVFENSTRSLLLAKDETHAPTVSSTAETTPAGEVVDKMPMMISPEIETVFTEDVEIEPTDEISLNPTTDLNDSLKFEDETTTLNVRMMDNFQDYRDKEQESYFQPQEQSKPQELTLPISSRQRISESLESSREFTLNSRNTPINTWPDVTITIPKSSQEIESNIDRYHQLSRSRNRIKTPEASENFQDRSLHESRQLLNNRQDFSSHSGSGSRSLLLDSIRVANHQSQPQQRLVSLDYPSLGENYRRFRVF